MTILKLQNEGDMFTGKVTAAGEVAGNFGPQVKFDFETGETLYMPKDSADRQLSRIPLGYAECVGESLTFSRDPNTKPGAKPYWGIRVSDIVDRARPAQPKRLPPPERKPLPFDEEAFPSAAHGESVDDPYANPGPVHPARVPEVPPPNDADVPEWVEPKQTPREVAPTAQKKAAIVKGYLDLLAYVKEHGALTDDVAIQSATATIWLTWKDKGLLP